MLERKSSLRLAAVKSHLESSTLQNVGSTDSLNPRTDFQFSFDTGWLSQEQRKFYEDNGYLVVRNLVPITELEKYSERFRQICDKEVVVPGMVVMKDISLLKLGGKSEKLVNKVQDFQIDPVLFSYCILPHIVKYVQCFTGPDVVSCHTMLINKPPDSGEKTSRHPLHQDLHYFPFRPADRIVCAWTAMQRVNRCNGCLVVIPGTHKGELLQHVYPEWEGGVNKMYHGVKNYDHSLPLTYLEMEAGDTVFFHPLLIHGSGSNSTQGFRKAISCHYASSYCEFIDVEGTTQANIADEVIQIAKKRLGEDVDVKLKDLFKLRNCLICGNGGTMMP